VYRNPCRQLFSASPWRAAGYLLSHLAVSGALFGVALTAAVIAIVLGFTLIAIPLLIAAASVIHGCANVERLMLRQVRTEPVRWPGHRPAAAGIWAQAKAAWRSGRTWRETGLLVGLWAPLFALDTIVIAVWITLLAGVALPLWYRAPVNGCIGYCTDQNIHGLEFGSFPHGPLGPGADGLIVNTLPRALLVAAGFAAAFLLFNYVLVAAARMHGRVALALLRAPADPLAEAKNVLAMPGPLGPLSPAGG
jgi:hypothetical protein